MPSGNAWMLSVSDCELMQPRRVSIFLLNARAVNWRSLTFGRRSASDLLDKIEDQLFRGSCQEGR